MLSIRNLSPDFQPDPAKGEDGAWGYPGLAYLVPALLLAHLAIPAQLLKPLGFDPVGDGLGSKKI